MNEQVRRERMGIDPADVTPAPTLSEEGAKRKCPTCEGSGETAARNHDDPRWSRCWRCKGTGKLEAQEGRERPSRKEELAQLLREFSTWGEAALHYKDALQAARAERKIDREEFQLACEQIDKLEVEIRRKDEALQRIKDVQPQTLAMFRRHEIVFATAIDKPDDERTDAERWEKIAFSIYADLCEADAIAVAAITAPDKEDK